MAGDPDGVGAVHDRVARSRDHPRADATLREGLLLLPAANETAAIGEALSAIVNGRTPPSRAVTSTFHAMTQMIGYIGATFDTWKVAPPLGVLMLLSGLFPFLPRQKRGFPAMVLFSLLLAAGTAAVLP